RLLPAIGLADRFESANSTDFSAFRLSPTMSGAMILRTIPRAGFHRGDEDEISGECGTVHRPAHGHLAFLEWLGQPLPGLSVEPGTGISTRPGRSRPVALPVAIWRVDRLLHAHTLRSSDR